MAVEGEPGTDPMVRPERVFRDYHRPLVARLYMVDAAYGADVAFFIGASSYVCPVVRIDDRKIGDGGPGPVVRRLQQIYLEFLNRTSI